MSKPLNIKELNELLVQSKAEAMKGADKKLVIMIGNTDAGKSTTINMLVKGVKPVLIDCLPVLACDHPVVEIGHEASKSCTLFSKTVDHPNSDISWCDTPGFSEQGRGETLKRCAARGVQYAIEYAGQVRGIVGLIPSDGFAGKAEQFIKFVNDFLTVVGDPSTLKKHKIDPSKFIKFIISKQNPSENPQILLARIEKLKKEIEAKREEQDDRTDEAIQLDAQIAVLDLILSKDGVFFFSKDASGFTPNFNVNTSEIEYTPCDQDTLRNKIVNSLPKNEEIPKNSLAIYSPKRAGIAKEVIREAAKIQLSSLIEEFESKESLYTEPNIIAFLLKHLLMIARYYKDAIDGTILSPDPKIAFKADIERLDINRFSNLLEAKTANALMDTYLKLIAIVKDLNITEGDNNKDVAELLGEILQSLNLKISRLNAQSTEVLNDQLNLAKNKFNQTFETVQAKIKEIETEINQQEEDLKNLKRRNQSELQKKRAQHNNAPVAEITAEIKEKKEKLERLNKYLGDKPGEPTAPNDAEEPLPFDEPEPVVPGEEYIKTGQVTPTISDLINKASGPVEKIAENVFRYGSGTGVGNVAFSSSRLAGATATVENVGEIGAGLGKVASNSSPIAGVATSAKSIGEIKAGLNVASSSASSADIPGKVWHRKQTVTGLTHEAASGRKIFTPGVSTAAVGLFFSVLSWGFDKYQGSQREEERRKYVENQQLKHDAWKKNKEAHEKKKLEWRAKLTEYNTKKSKLEKWEVDHKKIDLLQDELSVLKVKAAGKNASNEQTTKALDSLTALHASKEGIKQREIDKLKSKKDRYTALNACLTQSFLYSYNANISLKQVLEKLEKLRTQLKTHMALLPELEIWDLVIDLTKEATNESTKLENLSKKEETTDKAHATENESFANAGMFGSRGRYHERNESASNENHERAQNTPG